MNYTIEKNGINLNVINPQHNKLKTYNLNQYLPNVNPASLLFGEQFDYPCYWAWFQSINKAIYSSNYSF